MNFIPNIPIEIQLFVLGIVGAFLGGQLNRGIYRLAYRPRAISPWSRPHPKAPPRQASDRIPIVGWWGLRRETKLHGAGFWIRPMLIEAVTAIGLAWLYYWEVTQAGLFLVPLAPSRFAAFILHGLFFTHTVLISLLIVATFIDFDELTIPDSITLPGTIFGLILAAVAPLVALPVQGGGVGRLFMVGPIPHHGAWPEQLNGTWGLALGLACYLTWCFALLPRVWFTRHGWLKAPRYFFAYILRPPRKTAAPDFVPQRRMDPFVTGIFFLALVGTAAIVGVWSLQRLFWVSLLSSLVGMAFSGGLIWAVRIIGAVTMRREAMGFGDVTLMFMIGAFVGWQPALIIFALAPMCAIVIAVFRFLTVQRNDIPFGPYLSMGTLVLLFRWPHLWNNWADRIFNDLGLMVPKLVVALLGLMFAMLFVWQMIKDWMYREPEVSSSESEIRQPGE